MEAESGYSSNNGNETPSSWLQSTLSDLEERTNSMLSLIKLEDEDSFEASVETYYKKRPELEKQIEQFQKLYHLLLDQYTPILNRFSVSSISTTNQLENTLDFYPQSLNIDPESQNVEKMTEISPKTFEEKPSISKKHESFSFPTSSKLPKDESIEDFDTEILEKNISKLSETRPKISGEDFFERWPIDFEKRISCSEEILELVKDNRTHMDELMRRYEEKTKVNNRLQQQVEVLWRESQLLHDENLMLISEIKSLKTAFEDRVKEKRRSWLKALISPCMHKK